MPIKIEITADTPSDFKALLTELAFGIIDRPVPLTGTLTVEEQTAIMEAGIDSRVQNLDGNALIADRVAADLRKPRGRRAQPKDEPAPATDPAPMGPDEAAKAVHDHVPAEQKANDEVFDEEACRGVMRQLAAKFGADAPRALLTKFSVIRISTLDASQHKAFVLAGREMLTADKLVA